MRQREILMERARLQKERRGGKELLLEKLLKSELVAVVHLFKVLRIPTNHYTVTNLQNGN